MHVISGCRTCSILIRLNAVTFRFCRTYQFLDAMLEYKDHGKFSEPYVGRIGPANFGKRRPRPQKRMTIIWLVIRNYLLLKFTDHPTHNALVISIVSREMRSYNTV